jgi:D-alanyl-D-alanine carboxypeptidase (penicillin-binding protein 5/6)
MNRPYANLCYTAVVAIFALVVACSWPSNIPQASGASVAAAAVCANLTLDENVTAKAAYMADLTSGAVLYQKNPDAQLPLASLTKLVTMGTAATILSPDDMVTITREALAPEGDAGLQEGERWTAQGLIDFTLTVSANDGAHAIALAAAAKKGEPLDSFIADMNAEAKTLGAQESFFENDTGLDISSTTAGAYGSARDIAAILSSLIRNEPSLLSGSAFGERVFVSESGISHHGENTSGVIGSLPGAIASKTGYTDLAGGNLAIEFEPLPGRPVVAVVLGSTRDGRDRDIERLAGDAGSALKRAIVCKNSAELNGS